MESGLRCAAWWKSTPWAVVGAGVAPGREQPSVSGRLGLIRVSVVERESDLERLSSRGPHWYSSTVEFLSMLLWSIS